MKKPPVADIRKKIIAHPQNVGMNKLGYAPIFSASETASIVIIGQAPGLKAQTSEKPWDDKSGEQLRSWLDVSDETFYDESKIALMPMDFYFPGKGKTGDLPPRQDFAELWHPQLLSLMPDIKLTLLIGQCAQSHYLTEKESTLTETVRNYKKYLKQDFFPLPHPSPRNNIWKAKNPWFEKDIIPVLQKQVRKAL